ncbi:MAG: hypothetical protein DMF55_09570 [Acidobacteria bacterium]|nr:MAG: hypothetical protein DMF55_09570 [Acidobacteriota bacterium]
MSSLDPINDLLRRYGVGDGPANREEARQHYDQIAQAVPQDVLASAIGPALGSLPEDQVETRVRNSATEMTPGQRGNFLQTLLSGLASGGASQLGSLLQQIGVSPQVAQNPQQASPEDVGKIAAYANQERPDVFHQAMGFYAKHPTLVKVLGTMAIAAIAKNLFQKRPGLV